ncbi:hypothetical protein BOX15_Mlig001911g1 [Macrostomum lignano]|uniref:TIR domain-containing protein n=1 Tax=Macrostomum lignano TaxID=282301 RepID=A0A267F0U2_9PLAT|nr:hypothetical protein BOX15_Mlig001911g1 [Macrostomum lignano]
MSSDTDPQAAHSQSGCVSLEDARAICDRLVAQLLRDESQLQLETVCECGKQISKLYYDCKEHRPALARHLHNLGYPQFAVRTMKRLNSLGVFKNDDIWFSSHYLYTAALNYSEQSAEFAGALASSGITNLLVANIGHRPYLDNLASKNVVYLIRASLSLLYRLLWHSPDYAVQLTSGGDAGVVVGGGGFALKRGLLDLAGGASQAPEAVRCLCLFVLSRLLCEADCGALLGGDDGQQLLARLRQLVQWTDRLLKSPDRRLLGFGLSDFASCWTALSGQAYLVDSLCQCGAPQLMLDGLRDPGFAEADRRAALLAVWGLAMHRRSRAFLLERCGCAGALLKLQNGGACPPGLLPLVDCLLRVLQDEAPSPLPHQRHRQPPQAVLSHHPANRELAVRIRDRLRARGLAVRLSCPAGDSQPPPGVSIAEASVVLLGLSEAFRASPLCRAEAEAAALTAADRPVLPVCLLARWRPEGWLAALVGQLGGGGGMLADLAGCRDFEAACGQLARRVSELLTPSAMGSGSGSSPQSLLASAAHGLAPVNGSGGSEASAVQLWTQADVASWLEAVGLAGLRSQFAGIDGRLLHQLMRMRAEAPDYFYRSLEQQWRLELIDVLRLADALEKL